MTLAFSFSFTQRISKEHKMGKHLNKAKQHLSRNAEFYWTYGIAVGVGVAYSAMLYKSLKSSTPVNTNLVITQWLVDLQKKGFNLYALTPEQAVMWEECWAAAKEVGKAAS